MRMHAQACSGAPCDPLPSALNSQAAKRGLLLVDTKYEFGKDADGNILLIDEVRGPLQPAAQLGGGAALSAAWMRAASSC